ncbi:MAG: transcriptional regulator [Methylococcales symbiont of Hymedesmia sp. n. MRB-2018]|nr:MAG: transcriptional regulator [Methylococcales symbiont of Hymedesmia sp. n. MRB-2018]KAF3983373.1 MAG: transcriptional regulator [Methylococcales symbiont of Hymedesmia sp. n. MRB-2018]
MYLKLIRNDQQLNEAFERIKLLWNTKCDTAESDELDVLSLLIEKYEEEHFTISASEAVEAIKFLMEKNNLRQKDLTPFIDDLENLSAIVH